MRHTLIPLWVGPDRFMTLKMTLFLLPKCLAQVLPKCIRQTDLKPKSRAIWSNQSSLARFEELCGPVLLASIAQTCRESPKMKQILWTAQWKDGKKLGHW